MTEKPVKFNPNEDQEEMNKTSSSIKFKLQQQLMKKKKE